MENEDIFSSYESLRLQNIKRNENFLEQLGLPKYTEKTVKHVSLKRKKSDQKAIEQMKPVRRSSRVALLQLPNYKEAVVSTLPSRGIKVPFDDSIINDDIEVGTVSGVIETDNKILTVAFSCKPSGAGKVAKASTISANLEIFLSPADKIKSEVSLRPEYGVVQVGLCVPVEQYGKAAVMAMCNYGIVPSFSKYSGAVEWANCVFLWVNIGGSDYTNAFSNGGRHMMWYGGSRMHADSNVVLRLLKARKLDLNPSQDDKSEETSNVKKKAPKQSPAHQPVLLFTRLEKECYCCLGRLEWVAVDVQSSPVKFKWELVDFDEFCGKPHFQRILREC